VAIVGAACEVDHTEEWDGLHVRSRSKLRGAKSPSLVPAAERTSAAIANGEVASPHGWGISMVFHAYITVRTRGARVDMSSRA
jgi:hypothetical protein